jgi:hypothetical protein
VAGFKVNSYGSCNVGAVDMAGIEIVVIANIPQPRRHPVQQTRLPLANWQNGMI